MAEGSANKSGFELERLSIAELEALLQQDFIASKADQFDLDYTLNIIELIRSKEEQMQGFTPVDVDQAWDDFMTQYNTPEGRDAFLCRDPDPDEEPLPLVATLRAPKRRLIRHIAVAAILALLVAMSTIPVLGYENVFQLIGSWTEEQFQFGAPAVNRSHNQTSPDEPEKSFSNLQDALNYYGVDESVLPEIPEGFVAQVITAQDFSGTDKIIFFAAYEKGQDNIIISLTKHKGSSSRTYEKTGQEVETYTVGNVDHYIFYNTNNNTAAWCVGSVECSISATLSVDELKQLIDTIY